jgi:hypothetical protein
MRKSNEFVSNLAAVADVMNVISGGVSEPFIRLVRLTNAHQLEIKVPGVDSKSLSIEINNNVLSVYHLLDVFSESRSLQVPRVIFSQAIPHFINSSGIEASVDPENRLLIHLPFNERASGQRRKVRIKES